MPNEESRDIQRLIKELEESIEASRKMQKKALKTLEELKKKA
jgi:hypothetical protein